MIASRMQLAKAAVNLLETRSTRQVAKLLASYLVQHGKTQDMEVLLHDIEVESARRGLLQAKVRSARPMRSSEVSQLEGWLKKHFGTARVNLNPAIDEHLLGGVALQAGGQELDLTIRHKLDQLKKGAA